MVNGEAGKNEWIRRVLEQFEGPLVRYAMKITGDRESARDVVQETFLRLLVESPEALKDRLAPWLFTVCRNRALDIVRKGQRMRSMDNQVIPGRGRTPVAVTEQREESTAIMRLVVELPKNQQEVLRLKFQNGLSYREISEILDLTVSNVGYLIHVALKTLRQQVKA